MKSPIDRRGEYFRLIIPNPLWAEPVTHRLYFKADESFKRDRMEPGQDPDARTLHKIRVQVCTPRGRVLKYRETLGRLIVLDYNKCILSANFNPSKIDFNPWDIDLKGPSISFRLCTKQLFQVKKGDRLGCAAMIPIVGVPNWKDDD